MIRKSVILALGSSGSSGESIGVLFFLFDVEGVTVGVSEGSVRSRSTCGVNLLLDVLVGSPLSVGVIKSMGFSWVLGMELGVSLPLVLITYNSEDSAR